MDLCVMTVGTGTAGTYSNLAQGLVNTLFQARPRLFWLVPSVHPDSLGIADLVRESAPSNACFQPWSESTPYCFIPEPDNLFVCRETLRKIISVARKVLQKDERLVVNPTSGTKQMSVGATLAALDEGIGEIVFTVGEREHGVVKTGTERLALFSTEQFLFERAMREAEHLFHAGAYHGAALLLSKFGERGRDAHDVAACVREWQRLNYEAARQIAVEAKALALVKLRDHLIKLAQSAPESLLVLADILCSADDLSRWGDYEEALGRYYRAGELAAKLRLAEKHHLHQPYQLEELRDAAPSLRARFEANARDGVCYLGLRRAMEVLRALGDEFAGDYFTDKRLVQLLNLRNETVVGHGSTAVSQPDVQRAGARLRNLLNKHFPQLPNFTASRPPSLIADCPSPQEDASFPDQKH
jgi:hypothetical protein